MVLGDCIPVISAFQWVPAESKASTLRALEYTCGEGELEVHPSRENEVRRAKAIGKRLPLVGGVTVEVDRGNLQNMEVWWTRLCIGLFLLSVV
jgi:hypothetical protein